MNDEVNQWQIQECLGILEEEIGNEINFYLCSDKKSEHRTVTKTGTATIRKGVFSENAYMGTGEYEISCP